MVMRCSRTSEFAFRPPGFPSSRNHGFPETPSSSFEFRGTLSSPPGWTSGVLVDRSPTPESAVGSRTPVA
eukprot:12277143-Alexandrium_andersonii.AAC.1